MLSKVSHSSYPQKPKTQSFTAMCKLYNFNSSNYKQLNAISGIVDSIHKTNKNALFCILDSKAYIACEKDADAILFKAIENFKARGAKFAKNNFDIFNHNLLKKYQFERIQPLDGRPGDFDKTRTRSLFNILNNAFPQDVK